MAKPPVMRAGQLTTATARRTRATVARAPASPPAEEPDGDATQDEVPIVLDRYRLVRRLGAGGFGTVWMARDERLERDVAIKMLPRELVAEGRFEREAHAAARLSHPGIVTLYEAAADDEGAYLVSELVRGRTLDKALAAGRMSDRAILEVGVAVCDALAHAHAHQIVHRDVKPSNILIPARAPGRAKLTDFGVARVLDSDTLTRTGELIGTAAYMAPEQAEGREAGVAADLFSLALVLYEALTGVNPVAQATANVPGGQRSRRLAQHLPPLRRQRRELPRALGQAIDLALRPRPRERGTIDELRAALGICIEAVSDRPGIVESSWPARTEKTEKSPVQARQTQRRSPGVTERRSSAPRATPSPGPSLPTRALGAAGAAGVAAWLVAGVLASAPVPAASAALVVALAVLLLPRVGWLALCAAAIGLLCVQGRPGAGLIVALAGGLPVAVLPGAAGAWPLAAGAPALGLIGLAGAWPALAARAQNPWRRGALGALGWAWVLLGSALARRALYAPLAVGTPHDWFSLTAAWHDVVGLVPGPLLAGAAMWGAAAIALPVLAVRRSPRVRIVAVAAWALALALATLAALPAPRWAPETGTLMAGIAAAVVVALLPTTVAWLRLGRDMDRAAPRLA